MNKTIIAIALAVIAFMPANAQSFDSLFPGAAVNVRKGVFSADGYNNVVEIMAGRYNWTLTPAPTSGIPIQSAIAQKHPPFVIEKAMVIPVAKGKRDKPAELLTVYNCLQNLKDLAGREYFSFTRQKSVPLFDAVTRLDDAGNAVPDRPIADVLPNVETTRIRVKDTNFGNCYYELTMQRVGGTDAMLCRLTNYKDINLLLFTIIEKQNIDIYFYLRPIDEGVLMYVLCGFKFEPFAARHVDTDSAAEKRLDVVKAWLSDNISAALR
jgi:hypothetical protein